MSCWLLLSAKEMSFRVSYSYIYIYIYRGFLLISRKPGYIWVRFRVGFQIFLIKPGPDPNLV